MVMGGAVSGTLLIAAGLYQLPPLKHACLSRCRTPLEFILRFWREGYAGAFQIGIDHGLYCLGCCWLLFVILFPLGLMNLAATATITLLIFAEKTLPGGPWVGRAAGLGLTGWGVINLFYPGIGPRGDAAPRPGTVAGRRAWCCSVRPWPWTALKAPPTTNLSWWSW
jgi:predicted metal-binding membrane protein